MTSIIALCYSVVKQRKNGLHGKELRKVLN